MILNKMFLLCDVGGRVRERAREKILSISL